MRETQEPVEAEVVVELKASLDASCIRHPTSSSYYIPGGFRACLSPTDFGVQVVHPKDPTERRPMEVDGRNASAQPLLGLSPLHVEAPQRPAGSRTGQRRGQWAGRGDARAHSGPGRGRSGGKTY